MCKSLKVIRNGTLEYGMCQSLLRDAYEVEAGTV